MFAVFSVLQLLYRFHWAFALIPWNNGLTERHIMKYLRQHQAFGGLLAAFALGAASAVADSSLFPNGEPNWSALRTANSHSVASAASSLDAAYPASVISPASPLEARSGTSCASVGIGMRSDKFDFMIMIFR